MTFHCIVPVSQQPAHHIDPNQEAWLPRFRCVTCGDVWLIHPQPTEPCPGPRQ